MLARICVRGTSYQNETKNRIPSLERNPFHGAFDAKFADKFLLSFEDASKRALPEYVEDRERGEETEEESSIARKDDIAPACYSISIKIFIESRNKFLTSRIGLNGAL